MPSEVGQELRARKYLQIIGPLYSVNLNSKVMSYNFQIVFKLSIGTLLNIIS